MSTLARLVTLACTAFPVATVGACSPVDLHEDSFNINDEVSNDGRVGFYLIRDDVPPNLQIYYGAPYSYFLTIDGTYATWNTSTYAQFYPDHYVHLAVRSGVHALGIVDGVTKVATTIPAVEAKPDPDPTPGVDVDHFDHYMAVVFFGGAAGMNTRVLVNDPAAVPAGTIHVRVMNAVSDHQPLQIAHCPSSFGSDWTYKGSDCAPVGAPIAYGDVYETDAIPDVVAKLGFYWAAGDAPSSSAVEPINRAGAGTFVTHIPTELMGPLNACPSCFSIDL